MPLPKQVVSKPEIARYVINWGRKGDQGFVAVDEFTSTPVGAVWIRLFTGENKGYGYVAEDIPELSIAFLPDYRNQGMGTMLLKRLIEETRHQFCALSLSVSLDNPAARLYRRLGFETVQQLGASLIMRRELGADSN